MKPERWELVLRLYEAASALEGAEREAYLARECPDAEIAAEVRRLLVAPTSGGFLEPPALDEPAKGWDLGDFTLLEEIGRGGMGVVYRALQRPLERIVAVKVLPASFALTARQIERFTREACAAAKLTHPNLVTVLTVGEERGVRFFAMEYVDGKNLAEELARLRADRIAEDDRRAHLPSSHASDYFRSVAESVRQVADGLAFAHENGIVHRDVKPSNLLLDPSGRVKLVDFGLARDEELGSLSNSGDVVGTPHYMSPEQARSQRNKVDHRTDIYSLGVVLYELLTLQRPFEGKTAQEVLDNVVQREPTRIRKLNPRVPRDLETICIKAMAKEPRGRYVDAGAMRDDLQRFLSHEAIVAKAPGWVDQLGRRIRYHRVLVGMAGAVLAAGALGMQLQTRREVQAQVSVRTGSIASLQSGTPLRSLPSKTQEELGRLVRELRDLGTDLGEDEEHIVADVEVELTALERELLALAEADLRVAADATCSEEGRAAARVNAVILFTQLSQLFPDKEEYRRRSGNENLFPRLRVEVTGPAGETVPAEVFLRAVRSDTSLGPPESRGGALEPQTIRPGEYRVIAVFPTGEFLELPCSIGPLEGERVVRFQSRERVPSTQGMRSFAAARYTFPPGVFYEALSGKSVLVEAFLLDEAEVSNAEFAAFCRATGSGLPKYWAPLPDLEAFLVEHGDKPVVGIEWQQAVEYCAWAGKRLPTVAEWMLAAGGVEAREFPYLEAGPLRGNVLGDSTSGADKWQRYLANAVAVRSFPEARTPEGLYHMWGNVEELTESMPALGLSSGGFETLRRDRILIGGAWSAVAEDRAMLAPSHMALGPESRPCYVGFRCARSASP